MSALPDDTLIRCPECRGGLVERGPDVFGCSQEHHFDVREGVVDLVPESLRDETWTLWEEHLAAFQRRREGRIDNPDMLTARTTGRNEQQAAFVDFIEAAGTTWLDIGCGPGKFGHEIPGGTRYVGIDPIPLLPDVLEVEFARAVSERMPFDDGTFSDVVILHAIDHVRDVPATLAEIIRVLVPGGRLHILQNVIEKSRPLRYLAHEVKDFLEDRRDAGRSHDTPHHMTEFSAASLHESIESAGFLVKQSTYWSPNLVAPRRLMLSAQRS